MTINKSLWLVILILVCDGAPGINSVNGVCASETNKDQAGKANEAAVKHLFAAKLLLRRLEVVGTSDEQKRAFNELSTDLRVRIDWIRDAVGITKAMIKRRDEVYARLKKTDLPGDEFWNALQNEAEITAAQRDVFRETQEHYAKFRTAALALLTHDQRARVTGS